MMMKWLKRVRVRLGNDKGFTLVELLVVVGILGLLATIGVPAVTGAMKSAREAKEAADLAVIQSAVNRYMIDKEDKLPTVGVGGGIGNIDSVKLEPYVSKWPTDKSGTELKFKVVNTAGKVEPGHTP